MDKENPSEVGKEVGKEKIGYKHPPKEHQFKIGPEWTGNAKGRPKSNLLKHLSEHLLSSELTMLDNGKKVKIARSRAFVAKLYWLAVVKGDLAAMREIMDRLEGTKTITTEVTGKRAADPNEGKPEDRDLKITVEHVYGRPADAGN